VQQTDDWELVARAQGGDATAFQRLVERYQGPVVRFCRRMAGTDEDAEDLAQESFVRLHRYLDRLRPEAKFSTALFGIARNLTLNHLRDTARRGGKAATSIDAREGTLPGPEQADGPARAHEMQALIERGLAMLTAEHREVILLREIEGLDYEAIAEVLRCRKGTVKSRLARAREQLRLRLVELGLEL